MYLLHARSNNSTCLSSRTWSVLSMHLSSECCITCRNCGDCKSFSACLCLCHWLCQSFCLFGVLQISWTVPNIFAPLEFILLQAVLEWNCRALFPFASIANGFLRIANAFIFCAVSPALQSQPTELGCGLPAAICSFFVNIAGLWAVANGSVQRFLRAHSLCFSRGLFQQNKNFRTLNGSRTVQSASLSCLLLICD